MDEHEIHPIKAFVAARPRELSLSAVARRAGMTYVHLTRIMTGACGVNADVFVRLERATDGACSADELFSIYRQRRAARQAREGSAATRS